MKLSFASSLFSIAVVASSTLIIAAESTKNDFDSTMDSNHAVMTDEYYHQDYAPHSLRGVVGGGEYRVNENNDSTMMDHHPKENDGGHHHHHKACATLVLFGQAKCYGDPIDHITFTTETQPGSPCYSDDEMGCISVKDQYCNMDTGNFHQTIYFATETCEYPWYLKWMSPFQATYTTDSCIGNIALGSCQPGPCSDESDSEKVANWLYSDNQSHTTTLFAVAE